MTYKLGEKFSKTEKREILELCTKVSNDAYDQGGADALKILIETVENMKLAKPEYTNTLNAFLTIIEGVRQHLHETVKENNENQKQENLVQIVDGGVEIV